MVGISRKSTLARIVSGPDPRVGSDAASVGAAVSAFGRGATLFRVHDVRSHVEALAVAAAVERGTVER
jgi:dihydropteroate synthase